MEKKRLSYVKIFFDFADAIEPLGDAERGRLFSAMLEYGRTGRAPQLTGNERFVFPVAKSQMDRDAAAYEDVCEKRRAAGALGGRGKKKAAGKKSAAAATGGPRESICKEEDEEDEENEEDEDEGEGEGEEVVKEKEFSLLTTMTGTHAHPRAGNQRVPAERRRGEPVHIGGCEDEGPGHNGGYEDEGRSHNGGYEDGFADGGRGRNGLKEGGGAPPTAAEVAAFFRDEECIEDSLKQARAFVAYNESRGWDCLPGWQYMARRWVINMRDDAFTRSVEDWRRCGGGLSESGETDLFL